MWNSNDTTAVNLTTGYNSQLSFYEYPSHKPFINSTYQPLRPSHHLSKTVALPQSNRDQLLNALQSLSLRIKTLENEREKAELNLREITGNIHQHRFNHQDQQNEYRNEFDLLNENRSRKPRTNRKKKRSSQHNKSFETATTGTNATNSEGRHYHLDMNTVPFILGSSTTPSHNVKSNLQHVIALLKNHNHQLCLSSKEYAELVNPDLKGDISPHTLLYLDHYNKPSTSSIRPSSASPVRAVRRPVTASTRRPRSASRRPQSATISDRQCYTRIKSLRQEFSILTREHERLNLSRSNPRELEIITKRMEIILDELERLQKQLRLSLKKSSSTKEQFECEKNDTPLDTLRKTRLLQLILRDSTNKQNYYEQNRKTKPNAYE